MVALDAVVRMHARVVLRVGEHVLDGTDQRLRLVGGDLLRSSVLTEHAMKEPAGRSAIASGRDEDVDHLPAVVNGPIHVAPDAGDMDVGFVDKPAAADGVSAHGRARRSTPR